MPKVLLLIVLASAAHWTINPVLIAAEKISIALTTSVSVGANATDQALLANLISLVEVGILADDSLTVVERQQLNLALQELALNRTRSADQSLQLGKLTAADLLVMLELRRSDPTAKPAVILRVVESRTATIRGVTGVADLQATNLEDAAEQCSRYVVSVIRERQVPTVTVAVAPFESVGRFDRLRPLELGIRDLVTARLLWRTGVLTPSPGANAKNTEAKPPPSAPFQVLQRSSLDQLLRELDLIQSGFTDDSREPNAPPERRAAFLVKGEIDERQVDGQFRIVVRAELIDAATKTQRDSFEFECLPSELETKLATQVDRFAEGLGSAETTGLRPDENRVGHEAQTLKSLALRDVCRFGRLTPADFSHRWFQIPGDKNLRTAAIPAKSDTPLGKALILKSIDRLESILFIHPDDVEAAFALGFCYSLHQPGLYQPERSDDFLRKVYQAQPQSELAAVALAFLGEIAFHDLTAEFDSSQRDATAERLWLAFEHTPEKFRDHRWPRILGLFTSTERSVDQNLALLMKAVPYAEQVDEKHQRQLAGQVQAMARRLAYQAKDDPARRGKGLEVLRRWSEGTDQMLADFGRQGLAAIAAGDKDYLAAAMQYEASAMKLADVDAPMDRHTHDVQLIHAATNYRLAGQPSRGLLLLQSHAPRKKNKSLVDGMRGYEIGASLQALGEKEQALTIFLSTAEGCPEVIPNKDIVERIKALGGVPLSADRDIDVRYLRLEKNRSTVNAPLATDGSRLFIGGDAVSIFDLATERSSSLKTDLGTVTCLKVRPHELWVGTSGKGVWRLNLGSQQWTQFGTMQGLPNLNVSSLALHDNDVYVGIGSRASGGMVRIDADDKIHAQDDEDAPRLAPAQIVVDDQRLLAQTLQTIHELSLESGKWTTHKHGSGQPMASRLFAGRSKIWASNYGHELMLWNADEATNLRFKPAWYFAPETKTGVRMNFVAERGDEVWFGGDPWDHFVSSGLYRFHTKTGQFQKFTPRDGFLTIYTQSIYDGVWLRDRLWLTTSSGLCVVTPRDRSPK